MTIEKFLHNRDADISIGFQIVGNVLYYGIARCSSRDHFSKKLARDIIRHRISFCGIDGMVSRKRLTSKAGSVILSKPVDARNLQIEIGREFYNYNSQTRGNAQNDFVNVSAMIERACNRLTSTRHANSVL